MLSKENRLFHLVDSLNFSVMFRRDIGMRRPELSRLHLRVVLPQRRHVAPDREVFPGGVIARAPVVGVEDAARAVHVAPVTFDEIALERAQRAVVQRGVTPGTGSGKPADLARARQGHARQPFAEKRPLSAVGVPRKIISHQRVALDT